MKSKVKQFNGWLNEHMPEKAFFVLLACVLGLYVFWLLLTSLYDTDMYFLIASGNEMLEHGFIYKNVWTIDKNCSIIIQQWLYDVCIAMANKGGYFGLVGFTFVQLVLFFAALWHFLSLRNINKVVKFLIIAMIAVFGQIYLFSLRPELITLTFLLCECICLDHYRSSDNKWWLFGLIPLMLIEINFHASMWPVHFAILMAYTVPAFYLPVATKDSLWHRLRPILLTVLGMIAVMFINPYGPEGVLYIVKSFTSHTFDFVQVREVMEPTFLSGPGCGVLVTLAFVLLCLKFKVLRSTTLNICLGFSILAVDAIRNNMFLVIAYMFILRDFADCLTKVDIDWRKDVKNYLWILLISLNLFLVYLNGSVISSHFTSEVDDVAYVWSNIYDTIQEDYNEDMHIFTGFNSGAYFEYKGMKNLYIDARPELYTKVFTETRDILPEYGQYCIYGFNNKFRDVIVTRESMDDWFNGYDFDYVIVSIKTEMSLNTYMKMREDYYLVDKASNADYALYKKVS